MELDRTVWVEIAMRCEAQTKTGDQCLMLSFLRVRDQPVKFDLMTVLDLHARIPTECVIHGGPYSHQRRFSSLDAMYATGF